MQCTVCIQLYPLQKTLQAPCTVLEVSNTQKLEIITISEGCTFLGPAQYQSLILKMYLVCILRVYHMKVLAQLIRA